MYMQIGITIQQVFIFFSNHKCITKRFIDFFHTETGLSVSQQTTIYTFRLRWLACFNATLVMSCIPAVIDFLYFTTFLILSFSLISSLDDRKISWSKSNTYTSKKVRKHADSILFYTKTVPIAGHYCGILCALPHFLYPFLYLTYFTIFFFFFFLLHSFFFLFCICLA